MNRRCRLHGNLFGIEVEMPQSGSGTFPWPSASAREAFWKGIMESLEPPIRRYVATTGCSADEIDEIIQDVFGELTARESEFIACATKLEFALSIARDCCARAMKRWRHEFPAIYDASESPDPTTSQKWEQYLVMLERWCQEMLLLLPPKQSEAVRLHELEGRSYGTRRHGCARQRVLFATTFTLDYVGSGRSRSRLLLIAPTNKTARKCSKDGEVLQRVGGKTIYHP